MKLFHASNIASIATVRTGVTLRKKLEASPRGEARLLSAADLKQAGQVSDDAVNRVRFDPALVGHEVRPGDVLFKSRGGGFDAALISKPFPQPTFFSAPLLKVEVDRGAVVPGYLAWFLNSRPTQALLRRRARGSVVQTIGASQLREISIPLPPLDTQIQIAELDQLRQREQELEARLLGLKRTWFDLSLQSIANDQSASNMTPLLGARP